LRQDVAVALVGVAFLLGQVNQLLLEAVDFEIFGAVATFQLLQW
jgi:hypothetical protein